jgi:hypothetical protein
LGVPAPVQHVPLAHCAALAHEFAEFCGGWHAAPSHQLPVAQLASPVASLDGQDVRQWMPSAAQAKELGHAVGVPGVQPPEALQALGVSVEPLHEDPQAVPLGYTHAPLPSQSVAPHAPPTEHGAEQQ